MKLFRIKKRLDDPEHTVLQGVGHQIGREITTADLGDLAVLRGMITALDTKIPTANNFGSGYHAGYRAAINDVLAGFLLVSDFEAPKPTTTSTEQHPAS